MTAGTKHLSIARAIAHRYGNTAEARELADILGLVDEHGRIRPDDLADYSLGFAAPKVGKRAAEEHPRDLGARPKVSSAPEALRNLPPLPEPVKAVKAKPKPAVKLPARPPARKVGNKGRKLAPCGSYGAYRRHLRYGEQVDEACAEAARRQWRERDTPRERYLAPCGTYTALRRHRRLGETCDACTGIPSVTDEDRVRLTERRRQQGIVPRELKPHGTEGAYRRHIKYKTPVCDACRNAHNARNRELAAARNAA